MYVGPRKCSLPYILSLASPGRARHWRDSAGGGRRGWWDPLPGLLGMHALFAPWAEGGASWSKRAQFLMPLRSTSRKASPGPKGPSAAWRTRHEREAELLSPRLAGARERCGVRRSWGVWGLALCGSSRRTCSREAGAVEGWYLGKCTVCSSHIPHPHPHTNLEGRKGTSQVLLPSCLSSSGEVHSNGLLGFYWLLLSLGENTGPVQIFLPELLKLGAACDPGK